MLESVEWNLEGWLEIFQTSSSSSSMSESARFGSGGMRVRLTFVDVGALGVGGWMGVKT
jgi:hypothetical protein